jgi:hypothetical protein
VRICTQTKAQGSPRKAPTVVTRTKSTTTGGDATAVKALRQANAEQARRDTERLALHDVVHDKIGLWKNGKEGNLRALLAGLDTVLWEGCGWKKVGMAELVMPQKCKFVYMKGIAKVHPDKVGILFLYFRGLFKLIFCVSRFRVLQQQNKG